MKSFQVRLPDAVHSRIKELAKSEGISLNQFIVASVSNEVVRQETREFFQRASAEFDPAAFNAALSAVPDVEPVKGDEL